MVEALKVLLWGLVPQLLLRRGSVGVETFSLPDRRGGEESSLEAYSRLLLTRSVSFRILRYSEAL
jgi:hypothetical protein